MSIVSRCRLGAISRPGKPDDRITPRNGHTGTIYNRAFDVHFAANAPLRISAA